MTKPFVKDAAGHFRNLIEHGFKPYEPTPVYLLKRLITSLCLDISQILRSGTAADAKETWSCFNESAEFSRELNQE